MASFLSLGKMRPQSWKVLDQMRSGYLDNTIVVQESKKLLEEYPNVATLYLLLGKALIQLDKKEEARSVFMRGLEKVRDDHGTHAKLLLALVNLTPDTWEKNKLLDKIISLKGNLLTSAKAMVIQSTSKP